MRYRHRLGRLAEAEATYEEALAPLATEPALSRPRASLLAALAQLRWSQARRGPPLLRVTTSSARTSFAARSPWPNSPIQPHGGRSRCEAQHGQDIAPASDPELEARSGAEHGVSDGLATGNVDAGH